MALLFTNNAKSSLNGSILIDAVTLTVQTGDGVLFPNPSGGDTFRLTLADPGNPANFEIVDCTSRSTDVLTIARGQEGTSAQAWPDGTLAELRLTSAGLDGKAGEPLVVLIDGTRQYTGHQKVLDSSPTDDLHIPSKRYVDDIATGLVTLDAARVATTANESVTQSGTGVGATLTATGNGAITIDGVALGSADRVLVKLQTAVADNGVYTVTTIGDGGTPYVLTRATDFDQDSEVVTGVFVFVEEGTVNADTGWAVQTANPITVDTTDIAWAQRSAAGTFTASEGLTKVASDFQIATDGVTDVKIGNRTINDGISAPVDDTGDLTTLLSEIGNRIIAITGEVNWFDTPDNTISALEVDVNTLQGRSVIAGDGLSGGGTLAADRTFDVDSTVLRTTGAFSMAGVLTLAAAATPLILAANAPGLVQRYDNAAIRTTRQLEDSSASNAIRWREQLNTSDNYIFQRATGAAASEVFTEVFGIVNSTGIVNFNERPTHDGTNVALESRLVSTGTGLSGGGNLSANRTLTIDSTVVTLVGSQILTNKTLTSPDINGGTIDDISSFTAIANLDIGPFQLRAMTFQSDIATGTSPFVIASTTVVSNLNADQVDGIDATDIVQITGNQTVSGVKTFNNTVHIDGVNHLIFDADKWEFSAESATVFAINALGGATTPDIYIQDGGSNKLRIRANDPERLTLYAQDTVGDNYIAYRSSAAALKARFGFVSAANDSFDWFNDVTSASTRIYGKNSLGAIEQYMQMEPGTGSTSRVIFHYDSVQSFRTASRTADDIGMGAEIMDGGGQWRPVGMNVSVPLTKDASFTFNLDDSGRTIDHSSASAHTWTTPANTDTSIPIGAVFALSNNGTGSVTIAAGSGVTLRWMDGNGSALGPTGSRTLAVAGEGGLRKHSDSQWRIWGNAALS